MVQLHSFVTAALLSSSVFAAKTKPITWKPKAGDTWNYMIHDPPSVSQANDAAYQIWDMDMVDTPKSTIEAFKKKGKKVICYFSAGSWENWRADKSGIPASAIGKVLDGWPDEKWLDTRNPQLRTFMARRIEYARAKGCDGVDPDNIDGYGNDTGFDLTEADGVDYIRFLANATHNGGGPNAPAMSFGLKNGGDIVDRVVEVCEWEVNEECVRYNECKDYQAFIQKGKPVFHVEYTEKEPAPTAFVEKACTAQGTKGFSTIVKHLDLGAWTETCPVTTGRAYTSRAGGRSRHRRH